MNIGNRGSALLVAALFGAPVFVLSRLPAQPEDILVEPGTDGGDCGDCDERLLLDWLRGQLLEYEPASGYWRHNSAGHLLPADSTAHGSDGNTYGAVLQVDVNL
jgi:hypothetical protein